MIRAGLLLPQSILTATWFLTFALFVGFNTLIYVGLTMAKIVPWPSQIRPARVRALVRSHPQEDTVPITATAASQPPANPYTRQRMASATQNIPRGLALVGGVIIVVSLLNIVISQTWAWVQTAGLIMGLVMLGLSLVLARLHASSGVTSWVWAIAMAAFIVQLCVDAIQSDSGLVLTYSTVALVVLPPVSMSWRVTMTVGVLALAAVITACIIVDAVETLPWMIGAIAAFASGVVLLQLRLNLVDTLTDEQQRSHELMTTDPLTGLLSRQGLQTLAPSVIGVAGEAGIDVRMTVCMIDDLAAIAADYGFVYTDDVIEATARAVAQESPAGDLTARWSDGTFAVLGVGNALDAHDFGARVMQGIAMSGVALGKRPITVSVRTDALPPAQASLDSLVMGALKE